MLLILGVQENNRWAVGILPDGNYHLHVVAFNGAIKPNKGVYAVPPTLTWPEEFIITSYGANDTFKYVLRTPLFFVSEYLHLYQGLKPQTKAARGL